MTPNWRTSSYTETQNCVEVADNDPTTVMVRDTKTRGRGMIEVQRATWTAFVEYTRQRLGTCSAECRELPAVTCAVLNPV
ncbi:MULTISPECIES: DUF397 domain-containing protein [unclassified Streptomyces]|uniref:DUF397 domain-containing protein n=1 Tax=unclassified Streptomyces TaxID=2593676 RepID=UPI002E7816FB|nr:DUF397 domain-containing protein [Streptomyces sp. SP18BB07]MEE1762947.1 DUF397 domain-containing protein [Streptomyces sp. SP18BB07]